MIRCFTAALLSLLFGLSTFAAVNQFCYGPGLLCTCGLHDSYASYGQNVEENLVDVDLAAFQIQGVGWTNSASGSSGLGRPVDLTWGVVLDGTTLPGGLGEPATPSDLIEFLDDVHHSGASPGGDDLTQRAWFSLFESSFERWDELSGIDYSYQPDDGARVPSSPGILGVRGDQRIGGHSIDGQTSPTFLAYNYFPNNSDMVIDTDEINRWSDSEGNFLRFRNMLMHEIGHGLGLRHVVSNDSQFLMEPFLATDFDGPQFDDILAIHRLYGDVYEEGDGNETYLDATPLGDFWPGNSLTIGSDATNTVVEFDDIDFVSIDDESDTDFFSFSIETPAFLNLGLAPVGPTYLEGASSSSQRSFVTDSLSNLSLTLWDRDGNTVLEAADENGLGGAEAIEGLFLDQPGEYFISIQGSQNAAQFYELSLDVELPIPSGRDDFWDVVRRFGNRAGFNSFFGGGGLPLVSNIPEPTTGMLLACCGVSIVPIRRRNT